ncbi:MAG TPA: YdjY domain-containing protein [Thermoanaerobaculia bacterium]|nr:YdjY domain-containing protein [Thermoanaerobaculia bacterium]
MKKRFSVLAVLAVVAVLATGAAPDTTPGTVRAKGRQIEFPAVVTKDSFEREMLGMGMPGYHLIVWEDGRASHAALFRAQVTDVQVLDALEKLGAKPGNALPMETWDERKDPESKAPDKVIQGPPVDILVKVPGRKAPLTLGEILEDPGKRGFDMRFGGHRENIPKWKSGCVVCLYSCPGSKIGNARYTVRDYEKEATRFRVKPGVLPKDGTRVTIVFRLK